MKAQEVAQGQTCPLLSVAEAARYKNVGQRTIRRLIKDGDLPAERFGPRQTRVKRDDLDTLGKEVNTPPPDPIREAALRVVSECPKLTGEQLDRICALLRGVA